MVSVAELGKVAAVLVAAAVGAYLLLPDPAEDEPEPPQVQRRRREPAQAAAGGSAAAGGRPNSIVTVAAGSPAECDEVARVFAELEIGVDASMIAVVHGVVSDDDEQGVLDSLVAIGLSRDQVVVCEQPDSVVHIVRHLQPDVHVETNFDRATLLGKHIKAVILRSKDKCETTGDAISVVHTRESLANAMREALSR